MPAPNWRISKGKLFCPAPYMVAGIINITPDSFSDGGIFESPRDAFALAQKHMADGAEIIDIGAESTRPGAQDIGAEEEIRRLAPLFELMQENDFINKGVQVSVDTFRAKTAEFALKNGATIINDIAGTAFDADMVSVLKEHKPGYILGHSPAKPSEMMQKNYYTDIIDSLLQHFTETMNELVRAGLPEENICLDPCVGFGKNTLQTLKIFEGIPKFLALGRPLYFGISRKNFIGELTGLPTDRRSNPTSVVVALLAQKGVHIHRVHNVEETKAALAIVQAMNTPT